MASEALVLDMSGPTRLPIYLRIARALTDAILAGRLASGDRLPGTRTLAGQLGVQRNTVVAAYDELIAEGWVQTRPQRGTFVSDALPERPATKPSRRDPRAQPGFSIPRPPAIATRPPAPPGALTLSGGLPDLRLVPHDLLARAYRRALRAEGRGLLGYLDPAGHPRLRAAIAQLVTRYRGLRAGPENVLITRGAQMALYVASQTLLQNGDRVAVENLGYPPAWSAFRSAGAQLVAVDVDEEGLDVERLERHADRRGLRAVYVTPHHQYPTMVLMSPARRLSLLALAARHRMVIFEDDYDNEIHYSGQPVLPLASVDEAGVVVYIGTLSKVLAPGLRLGYLVAPTSVIEAATQVRKTIDTQGDHALERAVAELFEEGEVSRHVRRVRRIYEQRRQVLVDRLRAELPDVLDFDVPTGGLALWARAAPGIDVDAWAARARRRGVHFMTGTELHFGQKVQPFLRLGFAPLDPEEIVEAVQRMVAALP